MKTFTYKCPVCGKEITGITRQSAKEHIVNYNKGLVISLSPLGQDEVYLCTKDCALEYGKYLKGRAQEKFNTYQEAIASMIK